MIARAKKTTTKKKALQVALIETDPVRFVGFSTLLETQQGISIIPGNLNEIGTQTSVDLVLLGKHHDKLTGEVLSHLRAVRPDLRVIVVSREMDEKATLTALIDGAKGHLCESVSAAEFAAAIHAVHQGSIWAPRRVLAAFVDRYHARRPGVLLQNRNALTERERQVLEMLVVGCSNKEIGEPLGIEVRTVKAHIAKMLRKVGVPNRVALSVHALTHSLVAK